MNIIQVGEYILNTKKRMQFIDITEKIKKFIKQTKAFEGQITITTQHTTSAVIINENEKQLLKDVKNHLHEFAPIDRSYFHNDMSKRGYPIDEPENGHAHLQALLLGASQTLPIKNGQLLLGTWQRVLFIELDGPRKNRKYSCIVIANPQ